MPLPVRQAFLSLPGHALEGTAITLAQARTRLVGTVTGLLVTTDCVDFMRLLDSEAEQGVRTITTRKNLSTWGAVLKREPRAPGMVDKGNAFYAQAWDIMVRAMAFLGMPADFPGVQARTNVARANELKGDMIEAAMGEAHLVRSRASGTHKSDYGYDDWDNQKAADYALDVDDRSAPGRRACFILRFLAAVEDVMTCLAREDPGWASASPLNVAAFALGPEGAAAVAAEAARLRAEDGPPGRGKRSAEGVARRRERTSAWAARRREARGAGQAVPGTSSATLSGP